MVEKVKKEEMMNSFLYKALRADYEARTYCYLAMLNSDSSEEYIACYKKARKIYDLIKNEAQACQNSIYAHRILLAEMRRKQMTLLQKLGERTTSIRVKCHMD